MEKFTILMAVSVVSVLETYTLFSSCVQRPSSAQTKLFHVACLST